MERRKTKSIILEQAKLTRDSLIAEKGKSEGWCYEASCVLQKRLSLLGIETKLVQGTVRVLRGEYFQHHYWLEHSNRILDITGDQFNSDLIKEIEIPEIVYARYSNYHHYKKSRSKTYPGLTDPWAQKTVEILELGLRRAV